MTTTTNANGMLTREGYTPSGEWIEVTYGLQSIGSQRPYFSVTASMWTNKAVARRHPNNPYAVGQLTEEIHTTFPDLHDVVAIHLSNSDGEPMHAVANGLYWYKQGKMLRFARYLRINQADVPDGMSDEEVTAFIDAQRDRWKSEADAVRSKYDL